MTREGTSQGDGEGTFQSDRCATYQDNKNGASRIEEVQSYPLVIKYVPDILWQIPINTEFL